MIHLSNQTPLGTGRHRQCYLHPENAQRCIKIIYHTSQGGLKETKRELRYYAHLSGYLKDWSGIPQYYGTVETDLGTGYVYDVITDFDGKPSVTLKAFAAQCCYDRDVVMLREVLKKLKRYLHDNHIVTMTLKPQNILCRRVSESEVIPVVCDNIGESTIVPLATWSAWFCHRKQARLWQRFMQQPALAAASENGEDGQKAGMSVTLTSHQT